MILFDGTHLVSDTSLDELHGFARKLGLKREWFQDSKRHPHYDVMSQVLRSRAIRLGAKKVRPAEIVKALGRLHGRGV